MCFVERVLVKQSGGRKKKRTAVTTVLCVLFWGHGEEEGGTAHMCAYMGFLPLLVASHVCFFRTTVGFPSAAVLCGVYFITGSVDD